MYSRRRSVAVYTQTHTREESDKKKIISNRVIIAYLKGYDCRLLTQLFISAPHHYHKVKYIEFKFSFNKSVSFILSAIRCIAACSRFTEYSLRGHNCARPQQTELLSAVLRAVHLIFKSNATWYAKIYDTHLVLIHAEEIECAHKISSENTNIIIQTSLMKWDVEI